MFGLQSAGDYMKHRETFELNSRMMNVSYIGEDILLQNSTSSFTIKGGVLQVRFDSIRFGSRVPHTLYSSA